MSLLFDQNLSRRLPGLLKSVFPGAMQVIEMGLSQVDDEEIWNYALTNKLAIVSKDIDFKTLSEKLGPPPKVLWLNIGNGPTSEVALMLTTKAAEIHVFLDDPATGLLELEID